MAIWSGLGLGANGATVVAAAVALAVAIGGTVLIQQSRSGQEPEVTTEIAAQPVSGTAGGSGVEAGTETVSLSAPSETGNGAIDGTDANVSATVIGGDGNAPEGGQSPAVGTASGSDGAVTATTSYPAPRFDLVRIEGDGSAVIAGKSMAGKPVRIMDGDTVLAELVADRTGSFVAFLDLDRPGEARVLTLVMDAGEDGLVPSRESVVVTPPPAGAGAVVAEATQAPESASTEQVAQSETPAGEAETPAAPTVIIASEDGTRVVQPAATDAAPEVMANVTIDAITYDNRGEVVLAGRGNTEGFVRVYVDNRPVKTLEIAADGSWSTDLPEVDAGVYTLRVDELDGEGAVTSRVETPFRKEFPEDARRTLGVQDGTQVVAAQAASNSATNDVTQTGVTNAAEGDQPAQVAANSQDGTGSQEDGVGTVTSSDQTEIGDSQNDQQAAPLSSVAATSPTAEAGAPKEQATPSAPASIDDTPSAPTIEAVTVQPGSSLWELAKRNYGEGNQYIRIYTANKDQIKNPDLIYPGQIFEIPE